MRPKNLLIATALLLAINVFVAQANVVLDTVPNYESSGWDALKVDNGVIQLVIIPQIGGRIMFYGFEGDKYMAVNDAQMGKNYNDTTELNGPYSSWGYGGYKVWPAPQSNWGWPPPPRLDWGAYTYITEHSSDDSVVIYLESKVEKNFAAGLQQARRIKLYNNSTRVEIEQILKNVSCTTDEWSIWEVTQAVVDHNGDQDYENISTYFPSDQASLKVLNNMPPLLATTKVTDNVSKFNKNGNNQKMGALLNEGWSCFVDESDEQAYAKVFNLYPEEKYPDENTNFQIYSGNGYIEIEVLSPKYNISKGTSKSYTENWYAAHVKGPINKANHAGAMISRLTINNNTITGEYGIFNSGKLKLLFMSETAEVGSIDTFNVNAAQKFSLNVNHEMPVATSKTLLLAYDLNGNLIDTLDTWNEGQSSSINQSIALNTFKVFPNFVRAGSEINIQFGQSNLHDIEITLMSVNGMILDKAVVSSTDKGSILAYNVPMVSSGIYFIAIRTGNQIEYSKLIVR